MSIIVDEKETHVTFRITGGVFIRDGVRDMNKRIEEFKEKGKARFLIDFSRCDYISSEGMGAMADLWKYCSSQPNGKMVVLFSTDPDNDVHYLFDTIGLSMIMKKGIFTDPEEAEKAFQ